MDTPYHISTDKSKLQVDVIHDYLTHRSYWAKGRTRETVLTTIEHSMCFGMYDDENHQIGFARVVSDHAIYAYLMDVFVVESHRGQGLGRRLVEYILAYPELKAISRWNLVTQDAKELYRKFGFSELKHPEKMMEKLGAGSEWLNADAAPPPFVATK